MSLATRCPSCNTVFRVVQDQLKVSEGWVRCGRCQEVFNALESLFDLDPAAAATTDSPPPGAAAAPAAAVAAAPDAAPVAREDAAPAAALDSAPAREPAAVALRAAGDAAREAVPDRGDEPAGVGVAQASSGAPTAAAPAPAPGAEPAATDATAEVAAAAAVPVATPIGAPYSTPYTAPHIAPFRPDDDDHAPAAVADDTPAARLDARDRHDFADARFNSELLAEEGIALPDDEAFEPAANDAAAAAADTPEFLRRAEQRARWNRPAVLVAMALLCVVLLLGLAAQMAVHFRDFAAATWPAARPTLEALCDAVGCRVEPLRRIDDIVIESSALAGAPSGDAVRLAVVLRNRGALPLAMPSIELTLTDVGGQMIARRALSPAEFGAQGATLPPASETPLQLVLAVSGRRPSGYTVEPFYP